MFHHRVIAHKLTEYELDYSSIDICIALDWIETLRKEPMEVCDSTAIKYLALLYADNCLGLPDEVYSELEKCIKNIPLLQRTVRRIEKIVAADHCNCLSPYTMYYAMVSVRRLLNAEEDISIMSPHSGEYT